MRRNRRNVKLKPTYQPALGSLAILLIIIGLMPVFGCITGAEQSPSVNDAMIPDPDQVALEIANQALQDGDFRKALEGFEMLERAADEKIARRASYGRACAHLIMAETPSEIREALRLWQAWSDQVPSDSNNEDPRLLMPLIRSELRVKTKEKDIAETPVPRKTGKCEAIIKEKEMEIERLNNLVKHMENEIQTLSKTHTVYVGEMEKEIQALKDKIKSLEVIDQKMKEKKKEVSTP